MEPTGEEDEDARQNGQNGLSLEALENFWKEAKGSVTLAIETMEGRLLAVEDFKAKFESLATESGDLEEKISEMANTIPKVKALTKKSDQFDAELRRMKECIDSLPT